MLPGQKHTPEAIERIRAALFNRPCLEETREKISIANQGRKHTEFEKVKMKGRIVSLETRRKMSEARKGKKLGPPSQAHRDNISIAIVGFLRTPEQKREAYLEKGRRANRKLKEKLCTIYGLRCSSPKCRWLNDDGTFGCTDISILQLDHKMGKGVQSRKGISSMEYYRKAVKNPDKEKYQMLCPNCNWLKRVEMKEFPNVANSN
jgi:hypothetical protein